MTEAIGYVIYDPIDDTFKDTDYHYGFTKDIRLACIYRTLKAAESSQFYDSGRNQILMVSISVVARPMVDEDK